MSSTVVGNPFPEVLATREKDAHSRGLRRELREASGIDFSSNDYLGFTRDPALHERVLRRLSDVPTGARGSRLLSGHSAFFARVEENLAAFSRMPAALIYPSGYQANVGLLSALLRPGDQVYSDELNHASIIDGIRLSGAEKRIYRHGDPAHLRELLAQDKEPKGFRLIVTESIFSMEGDLAPLGGIAALARDHGASLVIDEAHATGIPGTGWTERHYPEVLATVHTGGKALGVAGAWVAGSAELKRYLVQFSRAQIFSTAASPLVVAALDEAVSYWQEVGAERARVMLENMARLCGNSEWASPIFPWPCGSAEHALALASRLVSLGFDVRAIRPPTVPEGKSRLRLSCPWGRTRDELGRLRTALTEARAP
jgi:8-amino-7-oxononanoate synthase